jgi:hypothetical protein
MEYLDNKASWEEHFVDEVSTLQQKMPTFDVESLSKSKLRLSLENRILDWKKYADWAQDTYGCSALKETFSEKTLKSYNVNAQQAFDLYSSYGFWTQDLLPVCIWENQLIIFGLQYNHNLQKIPNHIFVLAPPRVLSYFANLLLDKASFENELDRLYDGKTGMEGLAEDIQPISIDFKNLSSETITTAPRPRKVQNQQTEAQIWDLINERHEEYIFESKKQFSAFVILRINYDITKVFKLDPDLEKENLNEKLFEYSLKQNNPFKKISATGVSETFTATDLGLDLLNYKYVCISALKRSDKVVGFFLGFKNSKLNENDTALLEDLAKENAA